MSTFDTSRLIHDTLNLDNGVTQRIAWTQARVGATFMNVHCSQISNASVNIVNLPHGSTNFSAAQPFWDFIYKNDTTWLTFSVPKPPYWNSDVPGLNFTAMLNLPYSECLPILLWVELRIESTILVTAKLMFQPWYFSPNLTSGHHQAVIVLASGSPDVMLKDAAGSYGKLYNFSNSNSTPCSNNCDAYVQVLGCTLRSSNLTATISWQGRLLSPRNNTFSYAYSLTHDDHTWDEFEWENQTDVSMDTHFVFAFKPSSYYNTSDSVRGMAGDLENTLQQVIDGNVLNPFGASPLGLVHFQGTLEYLFASYIWNLNRILACFDILSPYLCAPKLFSSAELQFLFPTLGLEIVPWRAILSLICSVLMMFMGFIMLGTYSNRDPHDPLCNGGFLDVAKLLHDSSIPEVVSAPKNDGLSETEVMSSLMEQKIR
jgi:hypothetical protein